MRMCVNPGEGAPGPPRGAVGAPARRGRELRELGDDDVAPLARADLEVVDPARVEAVRDGAELQDGVPQALAGELHADALPVAVAARPVPHKGRRDPAVRHGFDFQDLRERDDVHGRVVDPVSRDVHYVLG